MPIYRTDPGVTLEDLVAALESRGEEIVSVAKTDATMIDSGDREWVIITRPMLRIVSNLGATETR